MWQLSILVTFSLSFQLSSLVEGEALTLPYHFNFSANLVITKAVLSTRFYRKRFTARVENLTMNFYFSPIHKDARNNFVDRLRSDSDQRQREVTRIKDMITDHEFR